MKTTITCSVLELIFLFGLSPCILRHIQAWIPPRPGSGIQLEPLDAMRQRLGLEFNYTPALLHPEICRYLTVEECQEADENMIDHAKSHRQLQDDSKFNPNLGSFKVLVLLIVFSDHVDRPRIAKSDVETMWKTLVPEWFDANSHGNYIIDAVVTDWVVTDNTEAYYTFGKKGITPEFQKAAWPALDALDKRSDWDWSIFDLNQDGKLDSVMITHSGYGAESGGVDEYGTDASNRIWPHAFSSSTSSAWTSSDGSVRVNGYTVASAFEGETGTVPTTIGLTVHEYMHTFGLPDLYDSKDPSNSPGVGIFSIMASPYGPGNNANLPGHLCFWDKMFAEWATPTVIDTDGIYTLQPLEVSPQGYQIILSDFGGYKEHLLLENRQKLEFDLDLPGTGLAIYHIDDSADGQTKRGYPGHVDNEGNPWPGNGYHYKVALLQADGLYELEQNLDKGDAEDLWQPGKKLGPGNGGTVFPNTDTYGSGFIQETGITITVLENEGLNVRFQVCGTGKGSCDTINLTTSDLPGGSNSTSMGPTSTINVTTSNPSSGSNSTSLGPTSTISVTTSNPSSGSNSTSLGPTSTASKAPSIPEVPTPTPSKINTGVPTPSTVALATSKPSTLAPSSVSSKPSTLAPSSVSSKPLTLAPTSSKPIANIFANRTETPVPTPANPGDNLTANLLNGAGSDGSIATDGDTTPVQPTPTIPGVNLTPVVSPSIRPPTYSALDMTIPGERPWKHPNVVSKAARSGRYLLSYIFIASTSLFLWLSISEFQ